MEKSLKLKKIFKVIGSKEDQLKTRILLNPGFCFMRQSRQQSLV